MGIEPYHLPKRGRHEPREIYRRLVKREPQFQDVKDFEPTVGILMRSFDVVEGGRVVLGAMHLPSVQGKLRGLFEWMVQGFFGYEPDLLMILDDHYWQASDPKRREILIYHEMCHMEIKRDKDGDIMLDDMTGRPSWKLRGHDVEEFTAVVERYGAWNGELRAFVDAANNHGSGT